VSVLAELLGNIHPALLLFSAVAGSATLAGIICHWDLERRRLALLDKLTGKTIAEPSISIDLTELLRPAPQPRMPDMSPLLGRSRSVGKGPATPT